VLEKPRTNGPVAVLSTGNRDSIDAEWLQGQFNSNDDDVLRRLVRMHMSLVVQSYFLHDPCPFWAIQSYVFFNRPPRYCT